MIKQPFLALLILAETCWSASGDIVVTIPDIEMPYTATSSEFTIQVQFNGVYSVNAYILDVALAGRAGADDVTFSTAADAVDEAATNYVFDANVGWLTAFNDGTEFGGDDAALSAEQKNGTYNLVTVSLDAALTAANIGDQYDLTFVTLGGASDIYDGSWKSISGITWNPGVITITGGVIPEPGSIAMLVGLGITSLALYRRRRRG